MGPIKVLPIASVSENALIVQSDNTVLLEVHAPRAKAELVKSPEHVHTYCLTALSIWNARSAGLSGAAMIAALREHAKYPVPDNVVTELAELAVRYGRVVLRRDGETLVCACQDRSTAERISRDKAAGPFLRDGIDATHFRVPPGARGALKQALVAAGYPAEDLAGYVAGDELRIALRERSFWWAVVKITTRSPTTASIPPSSCPLTLPRRLSRPPRFDGRYRRLSRSLPKSTSLRVPAQMMIDLEQTVRALQAQGHWKVNTGGALPASGRNRLEKLSAARPDDSLEPPDRVLLDYALLSALRVVEFDGFDARLEPGRADRLFELSQQAQASEWVRAWLKLRIWQDGVGGVPDRDNREESTRIDPYALRKTRELLLWALTRVAHSGNDWLDLETFLLDLYRVIGEHGPSFYWREYAWRPRFAAAENKDELPSGFARSRAFWMDEEAIWMANALLSTLVHLGLVERGRGGGTRSERWSFRLTPVGVAVFGAPEVARPPATTGGQCLTIQPNHEILMYLDRADGVAVTTLGRIASREATAGVVQTFKKL